MDETKTFLLAVLFVLISQSEASIKLPSEEWLSKTKHIIENSVESDLDNENFIFDNTDIKTEHRKTRDTSYIKNELKEYNEILKPEDAGYVNFGESQILNRNIFGYKSKPKKPLIPEKKTPVIFDDQYTGSGDVSTEGPTTATDIDNTTDTTENATAEVTSLPDNTTDLSENTTAEVTTEEDDVTTETTSSTTTSPTTSPTTTPPDEIPDVPPPIVPETDDVTTAIDLELPLNARWDPRLERDEAYRTRVMTDIELELAAVYSSDENVGYETLEVTDLRRGSIIADYSVIYKTEDFIENTEAIADFVTVTAVDAIVENVTITAIEGQSDVKANETILEEQASAVNNSIYNTSSVISSDPCSAIDVETLCPAGWTCKVNDDPDVNTTGNLNVVCESSCSTYFYEECDTDDGYCYLDYVVGSVEFEYQPKCACRDNTITISYDNCMHQNTIIIICSVVGGVLLIAVIVLVVVLVKKTRSRDDNDWEMPPHELGDFPRPHSGLSFKYEDIQPSTTTFTGEEEHKYTGLQKDQKKKTESNVYAEPVRKRTSRNYDHVRPSSSGDRGKTNRGYDDRSDSDESDRIPPRASRKIPVTDLDEDEYQDPDYYQANLRKIDPKAKYTIIRPSFMSRSRSSSHSSKE